MNKRLVIVSFLLAGIILASFLVSAAEDAGMSAMISQISGLVESIYNAAVKPLADFLIGGDKDVGAENFFTLIILFVLLVSLLYEITARVPVLNNSGWIQFVVSFAVSLISIRFLGTQAGKSWFDAIILPNQALGITLLCLIPIVIYWFFVMDIGSKSPTLAKILWIFAAVTFAVLYFVRAPGIAKAGEFNPAIIYLLAAGISIIFLIFDGTMRRYFRKVKVEALLSSGIKENEINLRRKMHQLNNDLADGIITKEEAEELRKKYYEKIKSLRS